MGNKPWVLSVWARVTEGQLLGRLGPLDSDNCLGGSGDGIPGLLGCGAHGLNRWDTLCPCILLKLSILSLLLLSLIFYLDLEIIQKSQA